MGLTALAAFADEVGTADPVAAAGGRTQWEVGGPPAPGVRLVAAPPGVVAHEPAEMIVRVRAGTTLHELQAVVGQAGQRVWLESDQPERATVGGILAVGRSGFRRLGWGPVRDAVLEVTAVDARGRVIRSGAPLVKNVTGFDLCRLVVGSLGTLALVAEVVLRCRPQAETEGWWVGDGADPFELVRRLYRPLSVLWDGTRTWVGLSGYRVDVEEQARSALGPGFAPAAGPPALPGPGRMSLTPAEVRNLPARLGPSGGWLAEVGVGVVHTAAGPAGSGEAPRLAPPPEVVNLHRAIKARFDPEQRLNPGRSVLAGGAG